MSVGSSLLAGRLRGSSEIAGPLPPQTVEQIVSRLSTMRGAALKLGQMLSIQGLVLD